MKTGIISLSGAISFLFFTSAYAKETSPTIKILVEDTAQYIENSPTIPVEKKRIKPKTETTVTGQELQRGAGLGGANIYQAVELTPSLNIQTDDAYGLGGGSVRLRGFDDTHWKISTSTFWEPFGNSS